MVVAEPATTAEPAATTTEPAAAEPERMVPLAALEAERKKRHDRDIENAELRGRLSAQPQQPQHREPEQPQGPPQAPKEDDFEDWNEYQYAVSRHNIETAKWEIRQEYQQSQQHEHQQRQQADLASNWQKQAAQAAQEMPDFNEVMDNPLFVQSPTVVEAVQSSDVGGKLAYYLGTHLDVANKINNMSPIQAARELGRIEAALLAAPKPEPPRTVSQAPAPVTVAPHGGNVEDTPLGELPMEEFFQRRKPFLMRRR